MMERVKQRAGPKRFEDEAKAMLQVSTIRGLATFEMEHADGRSGVPWELGSSPMAKGLSNCGTSA